MADSETDKCMHGGCQKRFSAVTRRHHCRKCGKIYCKACCNREVYLEAAEEYVRVCYDCRAEVIRLEGGDSDEGPDDFNDSFDDGAWEERRQGV